MLITGRAASAGLSKALERERIMASEEGQVTVLLKAMSSGDATAEQSLFPLVYHELHRLAQSYMRRERPDHTLQATALINEAYLKLAGGEVDWKNRQHFIGVAAQVMRHVLVDHARAHNADMRGGALKRVDLDEGLMLSSARVDEVLLLDEALERLSKQKRQAGTCCGTALFRWPLYDTNRRAAPHFRTFCEARLVAGPNMALREPSP